MIYEVVKAATGLEPGETYTLEELAKKGDVNNMVRKGIVRGVGFVSLGAPLTDSEAAKTIEDLQAKLTAAEDERDAARDELKVANRKIRAMEVGHAEGTKQLQLAIRERDAAREELALERATKPTPAKVAAPEPSRGA